MVDNKNCQVYRVYDNIVSTVAHHDTELKFDLAFFKEVPHFPTHPVISDISVNSELYSVTSRPIIKRHFQLHFPLIELYNIRLQTFWRAT